LTLHYQTTVTGPYCIT